MDIITLALARKYVDAALAGAGALQGKSAYEVAVDNGFVGSETEWLNSLKGQTPSIGPNGNWFIGGQDTGVTSQPLLDYDRILSELSDNLDYQSLSSTDIDDIIAQNS